jgi:pyruvate/2-oxoglutarate/acetoin dehydrogenase E1 component
MTQAAGFYNALLASDEPALVIECLNGYRLKEQMPTNLADIILVPGQPEILREGSDITVVTYGSTCRVVMDAAAELQTLNIEVQVIDAQSLLPFDTEHLIVKQLQKTNRIAFVDEDVPGGATSYMLQQVLEEQGGYRWLDSAPITITAKSHRPPYGSDGDYFTKPNTDDIIEAIYDMMTEVNPSKYPPIFI